MSTEHKCSCVGEKPINCNGNGECDNSDVVNTSTEVVVKTTPKSVSFVDAHEADSVGVCFGSKHYIDHMEAYGWCG